MFRDEKLIPALQEFIDKDKFYGAGNPPVKAEDVVKCAEVTKRYGDAENEWDDGWNPSLNKEYDRAGFNQMIEVGGGRSIDHIILDGIWEKFLREEVFGG